MLTAEQIKQIIKEELDYEEEHKAELFESSMKPDADPVYEFLRHLAIGRCGAYKYLLELFEELEK